MTIMFYICKFHAKYIFNAIEFEYNRKSVDIQLADQGTNMYLCLKEVRA